MFVGVIEHKCQNCNEKNVVQGVESHGEEVTVAPGPEDMEGGGGGVEPVPNAATPPWRSAVSTGTSCVHK